MAKLRTIGSPLARTWAPMIGLAIPPTLSAEAAHLPPLARIALG
jgi:hypothetical protein